MRCYVGKGVWQVRIFGKYHIPKWVLGIVLVAAGAGAAVGPVLAPKLMGRTAITATQALQFATSATFGWGYDFDENVPTPGSVPGNARTYYSVNDTRTQFTVGFDMIPTSSVLWVNVPVKSISNNQILAKLTLDVPDGISVDVIDSDDYSSPLSTQVGRLGANTWEMNFQADSTINVYYIFGLANGTPPGFYTARGVIEPENV